MIDNLNDLSRAVSHALRHQPWLYELELDDEGWTSVDSILVALRQEQPAWADLTEVDLVRMIETSAKRRHEIVDGRIRALYGHSLAGKLKRTPAPPPAVLHHGTSPALLPLIQSSGLLPMSRQYVHLSPDPATAFEVSRRKAKLPALLHIHADVAHTQNIRFYQGNETVWLADHVPPEFINFDG